MTKKEVFASTDLSEVIDEEKDDESSPLKKHIGHLEDDGSLDLLTYLGNEWCSISDDELPDKEYKSKFFLKTMASDLAKKLTDAIEGGNVSQIKYVTGYRSHGNDLSELNSFKELSKRMTRDGYVCYVFGKVGSGKTDFSLFLSELWNLNRDGEIGSNISSFKEKDREITCFEELSSWLESDGAKLFLFDEASSFAGGYGKQGYNAQNLIRLLKKFRKYEASLIIIGHTGKDIHPEIRRLCHDIIEKKSKKHAVIWGEVKDGDGRDKKMEIDDVPGTSYSFDTEEFTTWSWD